MRFVFASMLIVLISGCAPKIHTRLSRTELASVLESTFSIGMNEGDVVQGIEHLGLKADYDTNWISSLGIISPEPDIASSVRDKRPHFVYPYGLGVMAFTLDPNDRTLIKIEIAALAGPRWESNWWPDSPVVMMGEDE